MWFKKTERNKTNIDWMKNIKKCDEKKLKDLILPASHNSGAYLYDIELPILGFSTCQSMSIKNQLESGIRFFDFRISKKKNNIRLSHYIKFDKLSNALDDIVNFLNTNKTEIVVLSIIWDFSHKNNMDWDLYKYIINNDKVQKLLMNDDDTLKNIDSLRKNNKRLFIMTPDNLKKNLDYKWNNVWDQTKGIEMVKDYLLKNKNSKQFYWLKGEVTANKQCVKSILFNFRFGIKKYAKEFNLKLIDLLISTPFKEWKVNVISTDYIDDKIINLLINHCISK